MNETGMYVAILTALAAAIASGIAFAKNSDGASTMDQRHAMGISLTWASIISLVATTMWTLEEVRWSEDEWGVIIPFILKTVVVAGLWAFGGAAFGGFIGHGKNSVTLRLMVGMLGGLILTLTAIGVFMIAHPMISAMMALPVVVVALPVLLIGGWLLKNAECSRPCCGRRNR